MPLERVCSNGIKSKSETWVYDCLEVCDNRYVITLIIAQNQKAPETKIVSSVLKTCAHNHKGHSAEREGEDLDPALC